ncbi:MAG TPA: ABC transporter substrate-binding protein [Burkholderiales bacterium]|nr:ABC transporter substrate-binding protein [Burkholderiales bacterium]
MTSRRRFIQIGALGALSPARVLAQPRAARIGVLGPVPLARSVYSPDLVRRLRELGYRDLEYRSAEGSVELYAKQARELVAMNCDLFFAVGTEAPARSLREAGAKAPIVFLAVSYDPVAKGVVGNLRSPEGNATGVYIPQGALVAKRLEIMREVLPSARRMLVFADVFSRDYIPDVREAAERTRFELTVVEFDKRPYDYGAAFAAARKARAESFTCLASPVFAVERADLARLLEKHRLAAIGTSASQAEAGFLLSYTVNVAKFSLRAAELGARILAGAKPGDIPVEQADEFELVLNAKSAQALGIRIPSSVLARASRLVT